MLDNPALVRRAAEDVEEDWPRASFRAEPGEESKVLALLKERRLLVAIPPEEVWRHRGAPVVSGAFAVRKKGMMLCADGKERAPQRSIVNLVPWNALQHSHLSDASGLPHEAVWSNLYLQELELIMCSARDRASFFYLFSMP